MQLCSVSAVFTTAAVDSTFEYILPAGQVIQDLCLHSLWSLLSVCVCLAATCIVRRFSLNGSDLKIQAEWVFCLARQTLFVVGSKPPKLEFERLCATAGHSCLRSSGCMTALSKNTSKPRHFTTGAIKHFFFFQNVFSYVNNLDFYILYFIFYLFNT